MSRSEQSVYLPDEAATVAAGKSLAIACCVNSERVSNDNKIAGGIIYLTGDLGSGKTTLTRGIVRALGHGGAVKSPTYTLVEPYEIDAGNIYHFDLYRLADPEEVEYLGVEDYFAAGNLCIVEWPEKGKGYVPAADLCIALEVEAAGRKLSISALSVRGEEILHNLALHSREKP